MGVTTGTGAPAMTVKEWLKMQRKIEENIKRAELKALKDKLDRRHEDV